MEKYLEDVFRAAVVSGNIPLFDTFLKEYNNISETELSDSDKKDILIQTILNGISIEFVRYVAELNLYDIHFVEEDGDTLLHYAAGSDNSETVEYLLDNKLDVNVANKKGYTPLAIAAMKTSNINVIKTLLAAGADQNCLTKAKENIFNLAAGYNPELKVVKFIHSLGFDLEGRDRDGFTPILQAAATQSNKEIIAYLSEKGANIKAQTKNGENLFHLATNNHDASVVSYVSSSFHTYDCSKDGTTCMEYALMNAPNKEVLKIYTDKQKFETLMFACYNQNPYILESLFESGYDVNSTDEQGMTPFMYACRVSSNPELVKMFLCNGAGIELKDKNGRNVLHYAAVNKNRAIYDYIKDNYFQYNLDSTDDRINSPEDYLKDPELF